MTGRALAKIVVVAVVLVGGCAVLSHFWFEPAREKARRTACVSNLKCLQVAVLAYVQDYDGVMPPRPAPGGDFVAARGTISFGPSVPDPPGPVEKYVKNAGLYICPSDPGSWREGPGGRARSSYEWNLGLSGKRVDDVAGKPLVWDRGPWHWDRGEKGRNVAMLPSPHEASVRWMSDAEFEAEFEATRR